jgi:hypothetical protein
MWRVFENSFEFQVSSFKGSRPWRARLARRVRDDEKPPHKFIKFMFLCNFMSLDYELVVFASSSSSF